MIRYVCGHTILMMVNLFTSNIVFADIQHNSTHNATIFYNIDILINQNAICFTHDDKMVES